MNQSENSERPRDREARGTREARGHGENEQRYESQDRSGNQEPYGDRGPTYGDYGNQQPNADRNYGTRYGQQSGNSYGGDAHGHGSQYGGSYAGYEGRQEQGGRGDWQSRSDWQGGQTEPYRSQDPRFGANQGHPYQQRWGQQPSGQTWQSSGSWQAPAGDQSWRGEQSARGNQHWQGGQSAQAEGRRSFRGSGPQGYSRSDARIKEDICDRLTDDHDIDAGDISVEDKDGEVTLSGTVSERGLKHHIEDLVCQTSGVKDVTNNLKMKSGSSDSSKSGNGGSWSETKQKGKH